MDLSYITSGSVSSHEDFESEDLSGTESQIYGVSRELVQSGHSVSIIRAGSESSGPVNAEGIQIYDVQAPEYPTEVGTILSKLIFSRRAADKIRELNPDLVNVIMKYPTVFIYNLQYPVVHFAFNNPADLRHTKPWLARNVTGFVESRIARNVDGMVVRNPNVKSWAEEHSNGEVVQIPTAVHPEKYTDDGDEKYLLYGGRLSSEKNIGHLIRAFSSLGSSIRGEYTLAIVGEGPEKASLKSLADNHGVADSVNFYPWLEKSEFVEVISRATCAVLPSEYEGMPVFVLEAMACGKPVIGSDIPGIRQLISHGETGLLFDKRDIASLTARIERLLSAPRERERLGRNARRRVQTKYNFADVASQYLALYQTDFQ